MAVKLFSARNPLL